MLAEGLSRVLYVLYASSRFLKEYLGKVFVADYCAQNVDDKSIAANAAEQPIKNLRATLQSIQKAGLKLTMLEWHFVAT